jgi:hypothetical protein
MADKDAWTATVTRMKEKGAGLTDGFRQPFCLVKSNDSIAGGAADSTQLKFPRSAEIVLLAVHGSDFTARGSRRVIASAKTGDGDGVADVHDVACESLADERVGWSTLHVPGRDLAAVVPYVDIDVHMGIGPLHPADDALQCDHRRDVVFGRERMMCGHGDGGKKKRECKENEMNFHQSLHFVTCR